MSAMSARACLVFSLAVLAVPAPGVTEPAEASAEPPKASQPGDCDLSPLYTLPPA